MKWPIVYSLKSYLEMNKDIGYILPFQALVEKYNKLVIRKKYIIIYISLYFYKTCVLEKVCCTHSWLYIKAQQSQDLEPRKYRGKVTNPC